MGFLLGALAQATGGLAAPIVAHGVYDMLALAFIRRGALRT
jgi:membrane protease YdiL (CAAX protease family)